MRRGAILLAMCELFGVSSARKVKCNEMLQEFFRHGADNPDGWGIAALHGGIISVDKEPVSSLDSERLRKRMEGEIAESVLLAHIRKASVGNVKYENCHPFVQKDSAGRTWTLIHNGTIRECPVLEPYTERQKGSTDSERILYYLVDRMSARQKAKGAALTAQERFWELEEILRRITLENKVNLMICDGDLLYIHANMEDMLYWCRKGCALVFSTKPLDEDCWEKVPLCTLLVYRAGTLVYASEPDESRYIAPKST